ncbi:MAG: squalene/phytoene synthase family protein [Burkholderiales bacterium]|nr:squalene/phytoene synthase family protein [Burkholderiales bacterium]
MKTGVAHSENFPVASWLCPPALRPVIGAIYWFARTADDLADEGTAPAHERLADLAAYRLQLVAAAQAGPDWQPDARWAWVFAPLAQHIRAHALPVALLHDLLSAFEQDVTRTAAGQWYDTHDELLAYCTLSANPVGRLLLHLYGVTDPQRLAESDCICSALQLINFWQDLSVDLPRQRHYLPLTELARFDLAPADVMPGALSGPRSPASECLDARPVNNMAVQAVAPDRNTQQNKSLLIAHLSKEASVMMQKGESLPLHIPGRAGWELRLVVQGGLAIARKVSTLQHACLHTRPKLGASDVPALLWRAWRMG